MSNQMTMADLVAGCESEQLHLSGAIQPFGALLCLEDRPPYRITHASANLHEFTDHDAGAAIGLGIEACCGLSEHLLSSVPDSPGQSLEVPALPDERGPGNDILLVRSREGLLVELERHRAGAEPIAFQAYQRPFLNTPFSDAEVAQHHDRLVAAFHAITGFDRIMVYRFHEDWSGEVIAEATTRELGSYLGLRFPASDIPAIARNLYLLNPCRLIPDIDAQSVAVLGRDGHPPDLTWSTLRSVSPVHLQYLAHMGVGASFSVPIQVAGKLWGLVACHHRVARTLSADQRNACVALTRTYALGLTTQIASRRIQTIDSLNRRVDELLELIAGQTDPFDGVEATAGALMATLAADGLAVVLGEEIAIIGATPGMTDMNQVDHWFLNACEENVVAIDCLECHFPDCPSLLAAASGMLAVKARSPRSGWVRFYWFRPEEPREVAWAGNPDKPVMENAGAVMLSPRRSFEKWVEIKTGHSRPWSNEDRMTAAKFRNTLLRWL